jgi:hypothetical protein
LERSGSTGAEVGVLILLSCIGVVSTRVATGPRLLPLFTILNTDLDGGNGVKTVFSGGKDCILRSELEGSITDISCKSADFDVGKTGMRPKRRILIACCIIVILFLGSLAGTILYYYHHPQAVKALIEKSLSSSIDASFTVKDLAYSVKPMSIQAQGVIVKPGKNQSGFHLEIPNLRADADLIGRFGKKSLLVKNIMIGGFSVRFSEKTAPPEITSKQSAPSFLARVLKEIIALFLFREVRFGVAEVVNGEIAFRSGDQRVDIKGIQAKFDSEHGVSISSSARVEWPQDKMRLTVSRVHITTDQAISLADLEIRGLLKAQGATFESPDVNVHSIELTSTLIYDHNRRSIGFDPVGLRFEGVALKQEVGKEPISTDLELRAKGFFDLQRNHVDVSQFRLSAGDLLDLKGQLNLDFGTQSSVQIRRLDGHILSEKCLPFLHHTVGEKLEPFSLSGPISLSGDVEGTKVQQAWQWHGDMEAQLTKNRFSYVSEEMQLKGRVTGNITGEGQFPDINLSVGLKGDDATLLGKGMALKSLKASLLLSGKHPIYLIEEIAVEVPQAVFAMGKEDVQVSGIEMNLRQGRINAEKGSVALPEVNLTSSLLRNLRLSLAVDEKEAAMELTGKDVRLIESALALNPFTSAWQCSGLDSLQIRAVLHENERCTLTSKVGLTNLSFEDQDAVYMGEGITVRAEMETEIDLKHSQVSGTTSFEVQEGEVLYDRFYLDLNKTPLSASFKGEYETREKSLQLSNLEIGLKDIIDFHMHGTVLRLDHNPLVNLSARIQETPLHPIFHHFISEPFQTEEPFLSSMQTEGSINADMKLTGTPTDLVARGNFEWHDGRLSSDDNGFSLHGVDVELPIWYQTRKGTIDEETQEGRLSVQSMVLPFLVEQSVDIPLDVGPNRFSLRSTTNLSIPGGIVRVGPVVGKDIFSEGRSIETSLTLGDIEMSQLVSELWPSSIQGTIGGKLDPIYFEGDTLSSQGEIKVSALNGQLILSNVGGSNLLSSGPVFKLDAEWNDLSLAEMTTGTSFGKVEGVLGGHIKGLEIAYGQPQAFDLLLETVETKGVPQKISIIAVDNIAQIGGGQSPFMGLAGRFASLFKQFPYEKIGMRASLENDVFRINGTVREGGIEYLVKRGGISGVNIVNQNPDNRVSFKDMVKRIKRVTGSKSGPVVK